MKELEKVLLRTLIDPGFLDALKKEDYDPAKEYHLDDQEMEILRQIRSLHKGKGLEAFLNASSEAMHQLMPRLLQCLTPESRGVGHYDCHRVAPKLERVEPKLSRVEPKLSRVEPKLSKVEPKLGRVEPKLGRVAPKLERVEPKLSKVEPKLSRVEPKLSRVEPKLGKVEPKLSKVEAKLSRIEAKLEKAEKKGK